MSRIIVGAWCGAPSPRIAASQNLLTFCRLNKGRLHVAVVFNLTRFARDKYDHFALPQLLAISLRSATEPSDDTSTGKLMEGVLAAFAQFDNDVRSDRMRAGMRYRGQGGRQGCECSRRGQATRYVLVHLTNSNDGRDR